MIIDGRRMVGASFRGAPFLVRESERSGGRRIVKHKFPLRDDGFGEDLGRADRSFRVEAYVIGDDYLTKRDALLTALEDVAGPGELVHPYHGRRVVIGETFSLRETTEDGGVAWFSIDFYETPAQAPTPTIVVDMVSQLDSTADAANAATEAEFVETFDTEGMASFAVASASDALATASEALGGALAPLVTESQELAAMNGRIQVLVAQADALVRSPAEVLPAFREVIEGLASTASAAPEAMMSALLDTYEQTIGVVIDAITATRARERDNQAAIVGALRRTLLAEAARLAPRVPFASTEDASAARDRIGELLEEQEAGADDTAYPALVELRSQVFRALPGDSFATVVVVTKNVPIPSLVLAYQLYGSVNAETDIIARNAVRHPGFVSGDLKVRADG